MGLKLDLQCWGVWLRVQVAVGTGAGFEPDYCWAELMKGRLKVQAGVWLEMGPVFYQLVSVFTKSYTELNLPKSHFKRLYD